EGQHVAYLALTIGGGDQPQLALLDRQEGLAVLAGDDRRTFKRECQSFRDLAETLAVITRHVMTKYPVKVEGLVDLNQLAVHAGVGRCEMRLNVVDLQVDTLACQLEQLCAEQRR